jgi:hypothetical protein
MPPMLDSDRLIDGFEVNVTPDDCEHHLASKIGGFDSFLHCGKSRTKALDPVLQFTTNPTRSIQRSTCLNSYQNNS